MEFSLKRTLVGVSSIVILAGGFAPMISSVSASEKSTNIELTEEVAQGTYTFTNADFYETARNMGYDVEEPVDDPNYDPNQVNSITIGTDSSGIGIRSSILDTSTTIISSSVANSVKNVGSVAGAAILAVYLPGKWAAIPSIVSAIINETTITRDLQINMVLQRTMNGAQWFVTGIQWV